MNSPDHKSMEILLKQMTLQAPTNRLDQAIQELANESSQSMVSSSRLVGGRFGWRALIATALVASLGGMLLGHLFTVNRGGQRTVDRDTSVPRAAEPQAQKMTPVRFNSAAFDLLHGHSNNDQYANCGACHVQGEEAFRGWYYGDLDLFSKHGSGVFGKCTGCHVPMSDLRGQIQQANRPSSRDDAVNRENACSICHT